ncbi:hypothetical protein UFOVP1196_87 [uncultured Caudovirales phage]|uniref:Uncharacterized protein n=1 Tax=uncultured Caudovirales phage TaxID=2100421 RepID=A0A6J5R1U1_9CAUD|nr:hypothetical protein UFOVP1196_87 [uncultured Caudovirales phage]
MKHIWIALALLCGACAPLPPPVTPVPPSGTQTAQLNVSIYDEAGAPVNDATGTLVLDAEPVETAVTLSSAGWRQSFEFQMPPAHLGWSGTLTVKSPSYVTTAVRIPPVASGASELPTVTMKALFRARTGTVGIAGRTFVDAQGPWLAIGASHFVSGWLYLHDRDKFDRELKTLQGRVDFLRSFVLVGPSGYWEDRQLGPGDLGMVAAVTDAHYAVGFRTQWTVFAGIDTVPTRDARRQVIARLCTDLQSRQDKLQFIEVANEGWQNGFDGETGRAELLEHAAALRACLPQVQVALTAPDGPDLASIYEGSLATLATAHLERDTNGSGGMFRPIRQAREFAEQRWPWVSNEPIGPQSSVAADDNPERLALSAVYTWLCRGAAYVYHAGAGIRSGGAADLGRGRSASFADVPHLGEALDLMQEARAALPPDLPNWNWQNSNGRYPNHPFQMSYTAPDGTRLIAPEDQLLRSFAALSGDGRFVMVPLNVTEPTLFTAAKPMSFDVRSISDPATVIASVTLGIGQGYTLPAMPGALFIGRFQ